VLTALKSEKFIQNIFYSVFVHLNISVGGLKTQDWKTREKTCMESQMVYFTM